MNVDYLEFGREIMSHPPKDPHTDLYTLAVRNILKDPTIVLTPEQRRQCKLAAYGSMYGMGSQSFLEALKTD